MAEWRVKYNLRKDLYTGRSIISEIAFGTLFSNGQTMIGIGISSILLGLTLFRDHRNSVSVIIAGAVVFLIGICCLVAYYKKQKMND